MVHGGSETQFLLLTSISTSPEDPDWRGEREGFYTRTPIEAAGDGSLLFVRHFYNTGCYACDVFVWLFSYRPV